MAESTCNFCNYSGKDRIIFEDDHHNCICERCLDAAYETLLQERAKEKGAKGDEEAAQLAENANPAAANAMQSLLTPEQIYEHLNQYVIGQDKAKKILSVAVYNHMKRLEHFDNIQDGDVEIEKSNVILVGPSGSGKTHIVKSLARLFDVPYAIADATTLTESGYVGSDVETVLQKLLLAANGDVKKAERGIVFIDEIDKKANKSKENGSITRDVSGEGVQQALLKLLEGSLVDVQTSGQRRHPYSETVQVDTSHILFVVGGAFPGIDEIIKKRLHYKGSSSVGIKLGKGAEAPLSKSVAYNEVIEQITNDDLRKYGLIPEFIGRLPIIAPLKELTIDELKEILVKPKNALVKQYETMLGYDNVDVTFDDEAIEEIAKQSIDNKTGARGLRSIIENALLDTMFTTPTQARKAKHTTLRITKDIINHKKPVSGANLEKAVF